MIVYIVIYADYDDAQLLGAFSTPELAQEYIDSRRWYSYGMKKHNVLIDEMEIDKLVKPKKET